MDERKLTPATDEDLIQSLAFALRYNRSGKRVSDRDCVIRRIPAGDSDPFQPVIPREASH